MNRENFKFFVERNYHLYKFKRTVCENLHLIKHANRKLRPSKRIYIITADEQSKNFFSKTF